MPTEPGATAVGDFDSFVAARSPALLRTAYMLTGSREEAEDLVQSALARVYPRWPHIAGMDRPEAYVRRVLVTTHLRWLRRRRVPVCPLDEALPPAGADHADEHAQRDAVWLALGTLPRRQRTVLVLRYYEDLTEVEVAAILGISVGTVKSQASRALAKLRANHHLAADLRHGSGHGRAAR